MNGYLAIAPKYLSAHKKNTRLTIISVIISVALVTTVFSMLDVFRQFEKQQIISDYGNYHIIVNNVTDEEAAAISGRIDVEEAARYIELSDAEMNGTQAEIATYSDAFQDIFSSQFTLLEGSFPVAADEVALEQWAMETYHLNIGDTVEISMEDGTSKEFGICGVYADFGGTKAAGIPGVLLSIDGIYSLKPDAESRLIVRFKDHVNIEDAEQGIMRQFGLSSGDIAHNERLLAITGQSVNNTVLSLYATGAVLFVLVLVAGVIMIYNTFHISVMERVHQFGLLRCVGASKKQIKKLVRSEGRFIALRALPVGVLAGVLLAFVCSAILKFYNSSFFAGISLFHISIIGIVAGVAVGILTVFLASLVPAKKASRVSPMNAVSGLDETKAPEKEKKSVLTGMLHVDTALGVRNAVSKAKTLTLMSASIAISIILFLGFQVFVNFMYSSMKTTKAYTPDIELTSENGLDDGLFDGLSSLDGVKHVYGRMFDHVDATFDVSRLTETYRDAIGDIEVNADGTFAAPEKSWLISYDKNQLKWAKTDLNEGTLSEDKLNEGNGIVAVAMNTRNGVSMETASLKLGDTVTIQTVSGPREFTVMAVLRSVPFADSELNLATFITTEQLYTEVTGNSVFNVIDVQLKGGDQEQTVSQIKDMADGTAKFLDARQNNSEVSQAFLTMAVFVYGFVIVIALISILNIVNTMQTSVSAKTRYLGVMRAVGMSGKQLDKMVVSEAGTYSLVGCISGILLGIALQKLLITKVLATAHMSWKFPLTQIVVILALTFVVTLVSVIGPINKIKSRGISDTIGSIQ